MSRGRFATFTHKGLPDVDAREPALTDVQLAVDESEAAFSEARLGQLNQFGRWGAANGVLVWACMLCHFFFFLFFMQASELVNH